MAKSAEDSGSPDTPNTSKAHNLVIDNYSIIEDSEYVSTQSNPASHIFHAVEPNAGGGAVYIRDNYRLYGENQTELCERFEVRIRKERFGSPETETYATREKAYEVLIEELGLDCVEDYL